jgi:predicted dehydrogenase
MNQTPSLQVGIVGAGYIAGYVHYPGFQTNTSARVVALADPDPALLRQRAAEWRGVRTYSDAEDLLRDPAVQAVVLATPNHLHPPLAISAAHLGKHVLCEKPIALALPQAREMLQAAQVAGIRHMTAFTYRFVPAMSYIQHLVRRGDLGVPRHFRAQRFQDWPDTSLGWRQWKHSAGTGELGDMASHRIDFGRYLLGEIRSVCGLTRQFVPRDLDAQGRAVPPADTDDWVAVVGEFACGATGVWESTKLARGHGMGARSHDFVEVNGSEASAIYQLRLPYEIQFGRRNGTYGTVPVPDEFLTLPGARRKPKEGDPTTVWRYDQALEFVTAIQEKRECQPSFYDGMRCQAVIDAVVRSSAERRWVTLD